MNKTIILIGPVGAGKTTIAKLLSEKLNIPHASLDEERWDIYSELGYDFKYADKLMKEKGFLGLYEYWKPFEADSVGIILAKYKDHIIDFGAGQSVYKDKELYKKVERALKFIENVILILPSSDNKESLEILYKRNEFEHNHIFIENDSNNRLAKYVVYTKGKKPQETCDEIIEMIKR